MYRSVFDAKWRPESSLVLFLIKPVFLLILFYLSPVRQTSFLVDFYFIIGAETFLII